MGVYLQNGLLLAFLAVFLLPVSSASARFSIKVTKTEVNAICSKTKNPDFCSQFLNSKPKTPTVDLPGLAYLTIESASDYARVTRGQIELEIENATDPHSKDIYSSCWDNYDDAFGAFREAFKSLAAGDLRSLNTQVSAALDDVKTCDEVLKRNGVPGHPSILLRINNLEHICDIFFAISSMLPKQG